MNATPFVLGAGVLALLLLANRKEAKAAPIESTNDCPTGPITEDEVRCVQAQLHGFGWYEGADIASVTTGKVDDATKNALIGFQRANGLPTTGTLNQQTRNWFGPICVEECANRGPEVATSVEGYKKV